MNASNINSLCLESSHQTMDRLRVFPAYGKVGSGRYFESMFRVFTLNRLHLENLMSVASV